MFSGTLIISLVAWPIVCLQIYSIFYEDITCVLFSFSEITKQFWFLASFAYFKLCYILIFVHQSLRHCLICRNSLFHYPHFQAFKWRLINKCFLQWFRLRLMCWAGQYIINIKNWHTHFIIVICERYRVLQFLNSIQVIAKCYWML